LLLWPAGIATSSGVVWRCRTHRRPVPSSPPRIEPTAPSAATPAARPGWPRRPRNG